MPDINNIHLQDVTSGNLDIKEKRSSTTLLLMNPVASGDNVALGLSSAHRLKEDTPPLVPCCEGKELQVALKKLVVWKIHRNHVRVFEYREITIVSTQIHNK